MMIAITYKQAWRIVASVDHQAMRRVELLEVVTLRAEIFQVLAGLIELKDVIARVAVGKKDVAGGRNVDCRRVERFGFKSRFLWEREFHNDLAGLRVELDSFGGVVAGCIDEFGASFITNLHVVNFSKPGIVWFDKGPNHLTVWREDNDSFDRTNVDIACLIDNDATVRRTKRGFAVGQQSPAGNRIERHRAAAHAHWL